MAGTAYGQHHLALRISPWKQFKYNHTDYAAWEPIIDSTLEGLCITSLEVVQGGHDEGLEALEQLAMCDVAAEIAPEHFRRIETRRFRVSACDCGR